MPAGLRRYRATRFDTYYLLGLILLSTTTQIITGDFSQAILATVPSWMAYTSTALLIIGTSVTLLGAAWKGSNLAALQIEMVGRVTLAFPALGYGCGVVYYAHLHAGLAAALLAWLSVSCLLRAHEIKVNVDDFYGDLVMMSDEGDLS